jgi:NtrC-family two-component system sensor histidine kinase KinB
MELSIAVDENSRTAAIIESLELGVILLDLNGLVAHINELAALILGIEREDILDRSFDALPSRTPHYLRVLAALRRAGNYPAGEQQIELGLFVRGREHTYLLKSSPLRLPDGSAFGGMIVFHDVTYLRDKDRARTNLVATLSHELKTPLTSLSLAIELLQRNANDGRQRETLEAIADDLARIRDLSESLLNITRDETASITVRNITFDFAKLVASLVRKFALQAAQKQISLRAHVGEDLVSYGDPVKLSWVCSNLIANALHFTPDGGTIDVSATRSEHSLRLSVGDSGPGISREIRDSIFEPNPSYPLDAVGGFAGLGLAIAKEIVEAHGGRIFLETAAAGTRFTIDLPRSRHL